MSERPSDRFGERLTYYRKLAGLSAEALSRRVPGMSRAVIANIESGRKRDVTVDELIALAWALDVPPVVLALPIERPEAFIQTSDQEPRTFTRSWLLAEWFTTGRRSSIGHSPAHAVATLRLSKLEEWAVLRGKIEQAEARIGRGADGADWRATLAESKKKLTEVESELVGLGVHPTGDDAESRMAQLGLEIIRDSRGFRIRLRSRGQTSEEAFPTRAAAVAVVEESWAQLAKAIEDSTSLEAALRMSDGNN